MKVRDVLGNKPVVNGWGRRTMGAGLVGALAVGLVACGSDDSDTSQDSGKPTVVVTYSILGSVVSDLVGDAAEVKVLIPNGTDPHSYEPSAKDIEEVDNAALVVTNGLNLEETLKETLGRAEDSGVPMFAAGDHIEPRVIGATEISDEGVGADDPHLWTDPMVMVEIVKALAPALEAVGIDVGDRAASVEADLVALDAELSDVLAAVPADQRKLVTGHESLGYFADRYDFALVGAVIPSLSSQAESSAGQLADLKEAVQTAGVTTVFTELGTPGAVVDAIADEVGARVVELGTHLLSADGTYRGFMLELAQRIADGLTG